MMPITVLASGWEGLVRTTLAIDEDLLEEARRLSGLREKSALVREGLTALIERESARRLARLGGSEPEAAPVQRRRPEPGARPASGRG